MFLLNFSQAQLLSSFTEPCTIEEEIKIYLHCTQTNNYFVYNTADTSSKEKIKLPLSHPLFAFDVISTSRGKPILVYILSGCQRV